MIDDEYARMLGYAPGELAESNAAFAARLHPDDRERVARTYADYIAGKLPEYRVEFRQRTKQGDWKWILSLGKVMQSDASGAPVRMLGTHTDIDEEKQAQARIRRLTNLYAALSRCNEAILRIEDRIALLREICRVAVDHGGLRMAWVGELQDGRVVPVASFGARTEYAHGLDISFALDRFALRGSGAKRPSCACGARTAESSGCARSPNACSTEIRLPGARMPTVSTAAWSTSPLASRPRRR